MKIKFVIKEKEAFNIGDLVKLNWKYVYEKNLLNSYNLDSINYTQRDNVVMKIDQLNPSHYQYKQLGTELGMARQDRGGHWILPKEILIKINET